MGAAKKIMTIAPEGEIYRCPACGYTDGFHVSFSFKEKSESAEIYLICPNCHGRFRIGWGVRMGKGGTGRG
ncbi:MAG: hypothetical protein NTX71_09565 [Candidatus Aureabacteria bacterium]|nr:hypothetical protein [Candidatus Auribacterota bacterium]